MIWSSKFVFCIATDKHPAITDGRPYISPEVGFHLPPHLDDGVGIRSEHLPLEGRDLDVVFARYAVEHHCFLGLDDPVLASVGYGRTVRVIWRESVMSV